MFMNNDPETRVEDKALDLADNAINNPEAIEVAIKIEAKNKKAIRKELVSSLGSGARQVAIKAQEARVSRRLLLAIRSKKLTIVCNDTGIVSLMEVPVIPGAALVYNHPLSDYGNCRGLAQQGISYLRQLDTQTLAGIFIVLAGKYELIRFQPFDSGAQKNAIVRTAGKDDLIDGIILIENAIHSGNCQFLPSISLIFDSEMQTFGVHVRFKAYLTQLAEAIAKPDREVWDENAKPKKIGRPLYIRDVEKGIRTVSFLARKEIAKAKKDFAEDKKFIKTITLRLYSEKKIGHTGKTMLLQLVSDNALLTVPEEAINFICLKLSIVPTAELLIKILKKDRSILTKDYSEIEELLVEPEAGHSVSISEDTEEDTDDLEDSDDEDASIGEIYDALEDDPEDKEEIKEAEYQKEVARAMAQPLMMPANLSIAEKILWKKKNLAPVSKNIVQNTSITSVAVYKKPAETTAGSKFIYFHRSTDGIYIIGELENNKRQYLLTDDFGRLIAPKFFPHTEVGE